MAKLSKKQQDAFNDFLDEVDVNYWPEKLGRYMHDSDFYDSDILKYGLDDLQKAEDFLFAVAQGNAKSDQLLTEVRYCIAIYFGEVFMEVYGAGEWVQCTYPDEYFAFPSLDKWDGEGVFLDVFRVTDNALDGFKKGEFVRMINVNLQYRDEGDIDYSDCVDYKSDEPV